MPWDTKFGADAFGEDDETAPLLSEVDPTPDTPIEPGQRVSCRVTDETGLFETLLVVTQDGTEETVWDGEVFCEPYRVQSSVSPSEDGADLFFSIGRSGGWYASPSFRLVAIDTGENEGGP